MDSQGEMNPVQHENGLEQNKFLIPCLNFPVKEIITNWIDKLLGLAVALGARVSRGWDMGVIKCNLT